jgi:hypothetical protein
MWVYPETGKVDWKPVVWGPPSKKVTVHLMQGDVVIEDPISSRDRRMTVPLVDREAPEEDPMSQAPIGRSIWHNDSALGIDDVDVIEDLASVNSRSVPAYLRERALQRREGGKPMTMGSIAQAIRIWVIGGRKNSDASDDSKDTKRWLKELLTRPWKKRGSHNSSTRVQGGGRLRDFNWDRVGPRNEHLMYCFEDLEGKRVQTA